MDNPDLMTGDNINALTAGHGGLTIAMASAANSIANSVLKGKDITIKARNSPEIELDQVLRESIEAAKKAGAFTANAALLSATLLYFAGSNARMGCPGGNRKLGASARMIAGAEKGGVLLIPVGKSDEQDYGFPGGARDLPRGHGGQPDEGQGSKPPDGPDVLATARWPRITSSPRSRENAARIGTEAIKSAVKRGHEAEQDNLRHPGYGCCYGDTSPRRGV